MCQLVQSWIADVQHFASLSIDQQTVFFECLNKSFLEEPGLLTGTGVSNAFSHSDDTSSLLQLRPEDVIAVSTEDEGYEFSCWLITHFLRVLASPLCHDVRFRMIEFSVGTLSHIRLEEPANFKRIIIQFCLTAADLTNLINSETSNIILHRVAFFACKKVFGDYASVELTLQTLEEAHLLLQAVMKIMLDLIFDIVQYCPVCIRQAADTGSSFWLLLCDIIDNCGLELKELAMQLTCNLLQLGECPMNQEWSWIWESCGGLLDLLASEEKDNECDYASLSSFLTKWINSCLNSLQHNLILHCQFITYVQKILSTLLNFIKNGDLKHLLSYELRKAICDTSAKCCAVLSDHVSFSAIVEVLISSTNLYDDLQLTSSLYCLESLQHTFEILALPCSYRIDRNALLAVYKFWRKRLLVPSSANSNYTESLLKIIQAIGALTRIQDDAILSSLSSYIWMVSLPWLKQAQNNYQDLSSPDLRDALAIATTMQEHFDANVKCESIKVLALLPKDCAPLWRIHVFSIVLTIPAVQATAVSSLTFLLHQLGSSANFLIHEYLHPLLCNLSPEDATCSSLVSLLSCLACLLSRKTILHSDPMTEDRLSYHYSRISCTVCDRHGCDDTRDSSAVVDGNVILPFTKLLSAQFSNQIRNDAISGLVHALSHIVIRHDGGPGDQLLSNLLQILLDPDYSVRLKFSDVCPQLLTGRLDTVIDSDILSDVENTIYRSLRHAWKQSKHLEDVTDTLLRTVGNLARSCKGELQHCLLTLLLGVIVEVPNKQAVAVAKVQVAELARHRRQTVQQMFIELSKKLVLHFAEHLYEAQRGRMRKSFSDVLDSLVSCLQCKNLSEFAKQYGALLIPHLVPKADLSAARVIRVLAQHMDSSSSALLQANTGPIFCHLVLECKISEWEAGITFIANESGIDSESLLYSASFFIVSELLLHLSDRGNDILSALKIVQGQGLNDSCADWLRPKLLGIIMRFDNYLKDTTVVSLREKKRAYASLIGLMKLMGTKHITSVRVHLMTTLRIGHKYKEMGFAELCCEAWECYINCLELPALGSVLAQLVACLLSLLPNAEGHVVAIFRHLIIEQAANLKDYFDELCFLPDIPALSDVCIVLHKHFNRDGAPDMKCQMRLLVKAVEGDSGEVRQMALTKLKTLLSTHQIEIHRLLVDMEMVDEVIGDLTMTLLGRCHEADVGTRILCGECLGLLGALDPTRLENTNKLRRDDTKKFIMGIDSEEFAISILTELVKALLRAAERAIQDCMSVALQQLLKFYGVKSSHEGRHELGKRIWMSCSEEMKETLLPLMTSQYVMKLDWNWNNAQRPIYGSRYGKTFDAWVCHFTDYLAAKVKDEKFKEVFQACRLAIRRDSVIALHLLSFAVFYVLIGGNEQDVEELQNEILAVLNDAPTATSGSQTNSSDLCHLSAQTVFSVLDHLTRWCHFRLADCVSTTDNSLKAGRIKDSTDSSLDNNYQLINQFLNRIPRDLVARVSFVNGAYARSLLYYEQYFKSTGEPLHSQQHVDFLLKLFVTLDEPDGVTGIMACKKTSFSLNEQLLAAESTGQLLDASVCYDHAIRLFPDDITYRHGRLRCFLALGELESAVASTRHYLDSRPAWSNELTTYAVEAAWKLTQWDDLENLVKAENVKYDWNIGLGHVITAVRQRDVQSYENNLNHLRTQLLTPLSAASMELGSYHRGYEHIVRLHMLSELEEGVRCLFRFPDCASSFDSVSDLTSDFSVLLQSWELRSQLLQNSYRAVDPVLSLRRVILSLAIDLGKLPTQQQHIDQLWLQAARTARKCGLIQTAHGSLINASMHDIAGYSLENAKWLWLKGDSEKALSCLERSIEQHVEDINKLKINLTAATKPQRQEYARMLLLLGRYCEDLSCWETNAIVKQYSEVTRLCPDWEDGYFHLAKYYDKITPQVVESDRPDKRGEVILRVVSNFGQSLLHGGQYIYQSMPRLLTLWLDYGTEVMEYEKSKSDNVLIGMRKSLQELNKVMSDLCNKLANYQFLISFPQLISRLCHTHNDVFSCLKEIIAKLLVTFPQQSIWMMVAVAKSSVPMRSKRCHEIFHLAKSMNSLLAKFIQDALKLTDRLIEVCNKPVDVPATLSVNTHFKPLQRFLDDSTVCPILLPLQSQMIPSLPSQLISPDNHNPFPNNLVYIRGVEDTIEVLPSLQRPKKVTLRGTDGKHYIILLKPKEDLRKDGRLMEFNSVVNRCLRRDPESSKRGLHIHTFAVTPLSEDSGMLEWVPKTIGLRNILLKLYKESGIYMSGKELKAVQLPVNAPLEKKMDVYKNKLLARHPSVFSQWFLRTFPDPTSWFSARLAYCRTTAVMSVVGYILGLGDRHGENILLDSTSGDVVHVDFSCLFNKGESLDYPEIVPFRLTHNMIEAMGPMRYEGFYRKACEVTLRVMRDQNDPLLSVLKTFIYDPLVEWSKPSNRTASKVPESGEIRNEKAQSHVSNIESRLRGIHKSKTKVKGLPLSVEGHVSQLIKEATDDVNLCQMYIGWAAYL